MTDDLNTKPMLNAILERINALGEQLNARIDALSEEMNERFTRVDARLEYIEKSMQQLGVQVQILNREIFGLKTDHEILVSRVDNLESKAS